MNVLNRRVNTWGILPLDKPAGLTSHDVVDLVRKDLGIQKVGHAGTLDPLATGVLVVCVGRATRLTPYLTAHAKRYRARLHMGVRTDTMDAEGQTLSSTEDIPLTVDPITAVLADYRGTINQIPPMYSAKKVGGKRLHRLARAGKIVERQSVSIHIDALRVEAYTPPFLDLDIACSKGTYVRVLADDIGLAVGCGAHISSLRRTASGSISIDQCCAIDDIGDGLGAMIDPNQALADLPEITLPDHLASRFSNGTAVATANGTAELCEDVTTRVRGSQGELLGIGQMTGSLVTPKCVLPSRLVDASCKP